MSCVDWTAVAPAWDRERAGIEEMKAGLTEYLLTELAPLAGRHVLELGAGTGELAARLAEEVGTDGRVVASDLFPGMVALLERRLAGAANVAVTRLDAAAIDQPDASFDAVVFRMGLMLLPEPAAALQEARRVLRTGGRFVGAVWGAPQDNPWLTSLGMAAMMHGLVQGGPPVGPGTPFSLADPHELEKLFRGAGFGDVTVTAVDAGRRFADVDAYFAAVSTLAPPLAAALSAAPAEKVEDVRRTLTGVLDQFRTGDGLRVPGKALAWSASV